MKCCVLEDCNRDLNQIISCIQADDYLNNQLSIKSYTSTSQIDLTTDIFDILLLDIDLPDKNGIDFANDYIKIYPNTKIIFISSHNELVFDSFKVHPYSFIKKENINIELNDTLLELLNLLKLHKKEIVLNNKDHTTIIQQNDIIYIESLKHYCYIHTKCTTEPYKIRANMRQLHRPCAGRVLQRPDRFPRRERISRRGRAGGRRQRHHHLERQPLPH